MPLTALYALTVLLAATLLFLVQPMAARMLLPFFGGSPSVWTTCMLFFQVILLAGYCGAHALARLSLRWQVILLGLLAIAALGALPLSSADLMAPPDLQAPVRALLTSLLVSVGPPLLVLSATAPLLQRWFSMTGAPNPYVLYAASNLGSLVALLGYPFVVERWLPLVGGGRWSSQTMLWSVGYGSFVLAALATGTLTALRRRSNPAKAAPRPAATSEAIPWRTRLLWLALAFVPSSAMLGATLYLTTDVAAVPLLWILPLSIYLVTFIIAFSGRRPILERTARIAAIALCAAVGISPFLWYRPHPTTAMLIHLSALFVLALVLHRELARSRPEAERLTEFYIWIALGGALGGVFNALAAPALFDTVVEYPIALVLGCLLATRSRIPALLLAALFVAGPIYARVPGRTLHGERTFFGVVKVLLTEGPTFVILDDAGAPQGKEMSIPGHVLLHGTTRHGIQMLDPELRYQGTSYYHASGPIGHVFRSFLGVAQWDAIAVIGLGAGTLAAYGRKGQRFDFYEIDPAVARIAQDPRYFTYLADSRATVSVHLTDGRVGLAAGPRARFDLVIVDGFSSDAIPVHLMTREAFQTYFGALRPGGLLAIHATSKHFDLVPVVRAIADSLGLKGLLWRDLEITEKQRVAGKNGSDWVILALGEQSLAPLRQEQEWIPLDAMAADRRHLWTDDHASPLSVMKW